MTNFPGRGKAQNRPISNFPTFQRTVEGIPALHHQQSHKVQKLEEKINKNESIDNHNFRISQFPDIDSLIDQYTFFTDQILINSNEMQYTAQQTAFDLYQILQDNSISIQVEEIVNQIEAAIGFYDKNTESILNTIQLQSKILFRP